MNNLKQAAEQALKALESGLAFDKNSEVLQNLRAALAEAKARRTEFSEETKKNMAFVDAYFDKFDGMAELEQEPVLLECVTCGTVYADGVPPAPTAEDIAQDWDLLKATQESLREHMAEIHRLRTALEQQSDPLLEEQRLDIVATALRGHASTRDAIQWAIEAVERHHGIKE